MEKCWVQNAKDRPTIKDVLNELQKIFYEFPESHNVDEKICTPNTSNMWECFNKTHLTLHQGYISEAVGNESALALQQDGTVAQRTIQEMEHLIQRSDARNACVFLSLTLSLKAREIFSGNNDLNVQKASQCVKNIVEGIIRSLPEKINPVRDMDSYYSVDEAHDIMLRAGIFSNEIDLSEMLPSNPRLHEEQRELQGAVLSLVESSEPEAAVYVCPPLALTLLKISANNSSGIIFIVDTHAVPLELGGNGNGVVMATHYDEHSKGSKWELVCQWIEKRTSMYPIPNHTRQSLINIKEIVWDDIDLSAVDLTDTSFLISEEKEMERMETSASGSSEKLPEQKVSSNKNLVENVPISDRVVVAEQKDNETSKGKEEEEEILWTGYATKLGVANLKRFQIEAIRAFKNKRDCLIVQQTGSGKSLCFQIPALMNRNKFVLVISPTISLMESQVRSLRDRGIDAVYVGPSPQAKYNFDRLIKGGKDTDSPILVYCTPEYLMGVDGKPGAARSLLRIEGQLGLIVIDECHIIFERSGEFRYI